VIRAGSPRNGDGGETGPAAGAVLTRVCRYGTMSFLASDLVIGRSLGEYGEWAQREIEFLLAFVPPGGIVFDVGAHVGTHTLAFARRVGPSGRVYAFEPQPAVFALLTTNVARNGLSAACHLFNAGVAEAPGVATLPRVDYTRPHNFGSVALLAAPPAGGARVQSPGCHLIKADVEGMEPRVLAGAAATIAAFRPVVHVECWTADAGWTRVRQMEAYAYRSFLTRFPSFNPANYDGNPHDVFGGACETGLLFVPAERLAELGPLLERGGVQPVRSLRDLARGLAATPR
jgi:hypothetical protein